MKKILETIQNHPKKKLIISLSIGSLSVLVALSLLLVYYFTKPCEHFLDGGTITKEPTCTEAGSKVFLCQLCEYAEYTEIPLIEHNFKSEIVLDATCQSEGEEKLTCTVCSIEKTKSIPLKEEHTFEFRIINESTCTQKGLKEQECTVCGIKGIREEIELKNHAYTETIITHASCTTSGQKEFTCTCGNSYTETIPVKEHQWIEATCTTPSTCSVCNAVNGTKLGHDSISVSLIFRYRIIYLRQYTVSILSFGEACLYIRYNLVFIFLICIIHCTQCILYNMSFNRIRICTCHGITETFLH